MQYLPTSTDFEPIVEDGISSSEIQSYEQYSRQEIPRLFRSALEAAANEEAVVIEGRLRDRLVDIIRLCQDRAFANFSNYRLSNAPSTAISEPYIDPMASQMVEEATLLPASVSLEPPSSRAVTTLEDDLMHEWDVFDFGMQYEGNDQLISSSTSLESSSRETGHNESSDSAYLDDHSAMNEPSSLDSPEMFEIETSTRPPPQIEPQSQTGSYYDELAPLDHTPSVTK